MIWYIFFSVRVFTNCNSYKGQDDAPVTLVLLRNFPEVLEVFWTELGITSSSIEILRKLLRRNSKTFLHLVLSNFHWAVSKTWVSSARFSIRSPASLKTFNNWSMMPFNHHIEVRNIPAITILRNVKGERIVYILDRKSLE